MGKKQNDNSPVFLIVLLVLLGVSSNMVLSSDKENDELSNLVHEQQLLLDNIHWESSFNVVGDKIENNKNSFANQVTLELDEGRKEVFIGVSLDRIPDETTLVSYLEDIIYTLSQEASLNTSFRPPSKQVLDYGEVFDYYNILVGVTSVSQLNNPDDWTIHYRIPKGSHQKIKTR